MKKMILLSLGMFLLTIAAGAGYLAVQDRKASMMRPDSPKGAPLEAPAPKLTMAPAAPARFDVYEPTGKAEPIFETVDLAELCYNEIGLLCRQVDARRVPRCLLKHTDSLMKECQDGLRAGGLLRDDA